MLNSFAKDIITDITKQYGTNPLELPYLDNNAVRRLYLQLNLLKKEHYETLDKLDLYEDDLNVVAFKSGSSSNNS